MQVHPQISQFITLVLILSPHFKPSHPWNNYPLRQSLFTLNISDPSMNPSHSVHNLNNNFFFGTANNAVMNQIGTTTTTNWNRNTSNNKKHWQNRLDWNIKETATMTRSSHDRVNSFTTRLSHIVGGDWNKGKRMKRYETRKRRCCRTFGEACLMMMK